MKSQNWIMNKSRELAPDFIEFMKQRLRHLDTPEDEAITGLRIMGRIGQAMVDMAQAELTALKFQRDEEKPKVVLAS